MIKKGLKHKLYSTIVIIIMISSIIFALIPMNQQIFRVKAISIWSQSSKSDFNNGTLDNITLIENSIDAELRLIDIELNKWIEKTPPNSPLERQFHALAPIWGTDKILLFGGLRGSNPILNDTWIYDLSENIWIEKYPANHPNARNYHAMASVWGTDRIVLMGGKEISNTFNDTWIYDFSNNTWTNVTTMNNPGKIIQHSMATIYGDDKVVLFGGAGPKNKTWVYDLSDNKWTFKTPANSPPGRIAHSMTHIWGTDKILIFGGTGDKNDIWVYDLSDNNWTQMAYGPPGRFQHDIASIYGTDKVVLYGGFNMSVGDINDTWIFDFSKNNWTQIFAKNDPGKRFSHAMASVWGTDKIVLFSGARGPLINDTWIFNPFKYVDKGTFTSSPYEIGPNSSFKTISWKANVSITTSIKFKLRTAESEIDLNSKDFIGPDGSSTSYYISSPTDIWSEDNDDRWIQYKAYLSTKNPEETPRLKNVTITYNYWPNTTLIKPDNESIINNNCPIFTWNFADRDSMNQSAFQVTIDDDINFESINYDSNEQRSTNRSWHFPNGTNYNEIADGIWYWRVRTKDNDGDWGHYSQPWKVIIDSNAPKSIIKIPRNEFYNNLDTIFGIASDPLNGTGLKNVKIAIKRLTDNLYWTGQKWIDSEVWLMTLGTTKWTYNSSSIIWYSGFKYEIRSQATDNASNIEIPKLGKNFTMDFDNVTFSNVFPSYNDVSTNEGVEVGITISDQISGVNASSIEYAISTDGGDSWTSWAHIPNYENGMDINVTLNLTFPNGTGNRIHFRACDIAGNGPAYSDMYRINVYIPPPPITPTVRLLLPLNNTKVLTTSVKFIWEVINYLPPSIVFDIKLETQNPPSEVIYQNYSDFSIFVDELENGKTYYLTVIPKIGDLNGTCLSGVWSFTVDIPLPKVILKIPVNNSVTTSILPTLAWSLEYNGTETVSYDVYFGTSKDPPLKYENLTTPYYGIETVLQNNLTYYWKVVPWIGKYKGFSSETWSFTIKKDHIPHFELELKVEPVGIVMGPASIKTIKAFVTNKGELIDKISLNIEIPSDSNISGTVNEPSMLETESRETAIFNITLFTTQDIESGEVIITVTASSGVALNYGIDYQKELKVKVIVFVEEEVEPEKESEAWYIWGILVIIIIVIVAILLLILIIRKKKAEEIKSEEGIDSLKQSEIPTIEQDQEELSKEQTDETKLTEIDPMEQVQEIVSEEKLEPPQYSKDSVQEQAQETLSVKELETSLDENKEISSGISQENDATPEPELIESPAPVQIQQQDETLEE